MILETSNPLDWDPENIYEKLLNKISKFTIERGSGWAIQEILRSEIKIYQCTLFLLTLIKHVSI